jgi:hypothetical protein
MTPPAVETSQAVETASLRESKHASNAADVGDVVTIRWPASTIMCSHRNDADKVFVTGRMVLAQVYDQEVRVNNNTADYARHWMPVRGKEGRQARGVFLRLGHG